MAWSKQEITKEDGECINAQAPIIISASRSTDIPAFYADWFFNRLDKGYSAWTNPFNGKQSYISYQKTCFIVFWSKNPAPLIPHIETLKSKNINFYIQYTLNDYEDEKLERGVPKLSERINTFKTLVNLTNKGQVVWRFDPLILTDKISVNDLLRKIEHIRDQFLGYTEMLVFSFTDIATYKKVKSNLEKNNINYSEWDESTMEYFASKLAELNKKWNYTLATCGEKIDISKYGIEHNRCVDDDLMIRFGYKDNELMKFLGVEIKPIMGGDLFGTPSLPLGAIALSSSLYAVKNKNNKDKGQRIHCGCMISKDIGQYNTCPHLCEYCYANDNKKIAAANYKQHKINPLGETIIGK